MNVKTTTDLLLELIPLFQSLFETSNKPKRFFCKEVILQLQKSNLIEPLNKTYQRNFSGRNETTPQDTFVLF
jgi:hypothetical protein